MIASQLINSTALIVGVIVLSILTINIIALTVMYYIDKKDNKK